MKNTKNKIIISLISALVFGIQVTLAAAPEDVKGLAATAIDDQSIGLTWDAAKDSTGGPVDHYRIYYGKTSVFAAGEGAYDEEVDTKNNNTSYVINELEADTEYFFSITAFDSDKTESEQYAQEVSAKTMAGEKEEEKENENPEESTETPTDTEAPKLNSVSAPNNQTVVVEFSEEINLKFDELTTSFSIVEQQNSNQALEIVGVQLSEEGGKSIATITTKDQTENTNYILTASDSITDLAGNNMVKGDSDSGLFLGSSTKKESSEETPEEKTNCEEDFSCFAQKLTTCSKGDYMESDEEFSYKIELIGSSENECLIKYTADKHPNVLFASSEMECKVAKKEYKNAEEYRKDFNLSNCTGDLVSGYKATELKDMTPPEDVTNLMTSFTKMVEKYMVTLNWTASLNTAQDLVDQMLYMSLDRGSNYDGGKSLGASATTTNVDNLDGGKEYTFKITTKDDSGNESAGAIKSIRLPQTGLGAGLLLLGSAMAARQSLRRRRK